VARSTPPAGTPRPYIPKEVSLCERCLGELSEWLQVRVTFVLPKEVGR